jgi:replicative DNA helicase
LLSREIDVVSAHHSRKAQSGDSYRIRALDEVYGSVWLTAGQGSVAALWGRPGDSTVQLHHLKQPLAPVGPLRLDHDHTLGTSTVTASGADLEVTVVNPQREKLLAVLRDSDEPLSRTQIRKRSGINTNKFAERFDALVAEGAVERVESESGTAKWRLRG